MLPLIPKISKIHIDPVDFSLLKSLKGKRVILTPNHAEMKEPYVVFALSRMLREEFNYLTAREVFEDYFPAGRLLQSLGCYSVLRGAPDRNALRVTTEILVEGKHWLVIFPEGVAMGLGDALMPFQPGMGQFAFRAYDELRKEGKDFAILFVPMAIKTFYTQHMDNSIDRALARLEMKLLPGTNQKKKDHQGRLLALGEALLGSREQEYSVIPRPGASLSERIKFMRELIITTTATQIGLQDHPDQIVPDRLRDLANALDKIVHQHDHNEEPFQESLGPWRKQAKALRRRLETAANFMALDPCYLDSQMTTERFLDLVGLLEREVFGARRFWGQRKAVIKVGKPVDLADFAGHYRISKKEAFQAVSRTLEAKVREMLVELSARSVPMSLAKKSRRLSAGKDQDFE